MDGNHENHDYGVRGIQFSRRKVFYIFRAEFRTKSCLGVTFGGKSVLIKFLFRMFFLSIEQILSRARFDFRVILDKKL